MAISLVDDWGDYRNWSSPSDARTGTINALAASTNRINSTAFDYFSDSAVVDDCIYFGLKRFTWGIKLYVGTAFAATSVTFVWEYYDEIAGAWTTLPVTNPNALLSTGEQKVEWVPPHHWRETQSYSTDWVFVVRCRITAISGISEGGAQSTQYVEFNQKSIEVTGTVSGLTSLRTADLAGTYTILTATTPAASLTPLFMPVDLIRRMSKVDVVLVSSDAAASDTVVLTGLNIEGDAISETIDVSSGDGTYTSTQSYSCITDVACNGFSAGTIEVQQKRWGLIDYENNATWNVGTFLTVGDGSTTSALTITGYTINYHKGFYARTQASGTLTYGAIYNEGASNEYTAYGCQINEDAGDYQQLSISTYWLRNKTATGSHNFYCTSYKFWGSSYTVNTILYFLYGSVKMVDVLLTRGTATIGELYLNNLESLTIRRVTSFLPINISGMKNANLQDFTDARCYYTSLSSTGSTYAYTLINPAFDAARCWIYSNGYFEIRDASMVPDNFLVGYNGITGTTDVIRLTYSFDLTLIDSQGNAIEGATVKIVDVEGTEVFNDTTDSNGQLSTVLNWQLAQHVVGAGVFTWDVKTPHIATITKTGYVTKKIIYTADHTLNEVEVLENRREV